MSGRPAARVRLRLRGPGGVEATVTATVDTGFTGTLTLSDRLIASLGLEYLTDVVFVQADGTAALHPAYATELEWGGVWRPIYVAAGREPLIGLKLLLDHEVRMEVRPGGAVEITPLA